MPTLSQKPPRLARWLIQVLVREELQEEVYGDLEQCYYDSIRRSGRWRARMFYWYQVVQYLRPFAMKRSRPTYNPSIMLQNYIKIGFRNLLKYKGYSSINIGGLAVGMAVAILIGLWVHDELTFNRHYANYDRLAKVMKGGTFQGQYY